MHRKNFIKNSLLTTGAMLLPNAIWALKENKDLTITANKFLSSPNLNRFKVSNTGTKFFETELSILKTHSSRTLNGEYFISENTEGYGTPALLENEKDTFVFIPELYQDKRHNGFIVKLCADGLCEETKIFTHENQGFYAFWGKEYLQQPTLYHYNVETLHLMRAHRENDQWINHRVMPLYPHEMIALYNQQLKQVSEGQLQQQFGYNFEIQKDGFYRFLELKHGWEQAIITKQKEDFERANPARAYSDLSDVPRAIKVTASDGYTNPFVAIYCKGDDLSHAITKPAIIYEEVAGSKIEIPDMPAYKTQDELGECRAFSLAVLLQHYTCQRWKLEIPDCKNPPPDSAISYFGLLAYTNQSQGQDETFQPNQRKARSMYNIINDLSKKGNQLILEDCKPFENLLTQFTLEEEGSIKKDKFFNYLKITFDTFKSKAISESGDYSQQILKINSYVDLKISEVAFKKALTTSSFDQYLYTLFFNDCKFENFPSGFTANAYPDDSIHASEEDIINKIKEGIKLGKPILYTGICIGNTGNDCTMTHTVVISGYKKVSEVGNSLKTRNVVKVHNSWGAGWQKLNNDGWVDADTVVRNTGKLKNESGYHLGSGTVIWLE